MILSSCLQTPGPQRGCFWGRVTLQCPVPWSWSWPHLWMLSFEPSNSRWIQFNFRLDAEVQLDYHHLLAVVQCFFSPCARSLLLQLQCRRENADSSVVLCSSFLCVALTFQMLCYIVTKGNGHTHTHRNTRETNNWLELVQDLKWIFFRCLIETSSHSAARVLRWRGVFQRVDGHGLAVWLSSPGRAYGPHASPLGLFTYVCAAGCGEKPVFTLQTNTVPSVLTQTTGSNLAETAETGLKMHRSAVGEFCRWWCH